MTILSLLEDFWHLRKRQEETGSMDEKNLRKVSRVFRIFAQNPIQISLSLSSPLLSLSLSLSQKQAKPSTMECLPKCEERERERERVTFCNSAPAFLHN